MPYSLPALLDQIQNGLIVSCHADAAPMLDPHDLLHMYASAAEEGGARAIRVEGVAAVAALRSRTTLPIIGFVKGVYADGSDLITPALEDVEGLFTAGADVVAIDATKRKRPSGVDGFTFFDEARRRFSRPLWADCSLFREGVRAAEAGADIVATTLSGYTPATVETDHGEPDIAMIRELAMSLVIPVVAEGRIWSPQSAMRALEAGAHAVVVGSAITRPSVITRMFAEALHVSSERQA